MKPWTRFPPPSPRWPTRRAAPSWRAWPTATPTSANWRQPFDISGPAISRHLRVLEDAGLISREVNAQWRLCRLRTPALQQAHGWLEHYAEHWERSLDRLTELVEARQQHSPRKPARRRTPR